MKTKDTRARKLEIFENEVNVILQFWHHNCFWFSKYTKQKPVHTRHIFWISISARHFIEMCLQWQQCTLTTTIASKRTTITRKHQQLLIISLVFCDLFSVQEQNYGKEKKVKAKTIKPHQKVFVRICCYTFLSI